MPNVSYLPVLRAANHIRCVPSLVVQQIAESS